MDETQSGDAVPDAAPDAPEDVSAFARNRTRIVAAIAAGVVVLGGLIAFLATRDSGGSNGDGATAAAIENTTTTSGSGSPSTSDRTDTTLRNSSSTSVKSGAGPGTTQPGQKPGSTVGSTKATTDTRPRVDTVTPTTKVGIHYIPNPLPSVPSTAGIPPTLLAAYTAGYQAECRHIWAITADRDGLLWDADWLEQGGIKVNICYQQEDPTYADSYDTPADAQQGGTFDADSDMSDWTLGGTLINTSRTKTWTG